MLCHIEILGLVEIPQNIDFSDALKGEKEVAIDCYIEAQGLAIETSIFEDISSKINKLLEIK
jgi:hypothetical protein